MSQAHGAAEPWRKTRAWAPDISSPANNVGDGPSLPNIRLTEGWANPTTGGEGGGYVNNGVPAEDMATPPPEDSSGSSDDGDEDGH